MTVKVNVSALTRLAKRQAKAAERIEPAVSAIVVKNAELLARAAKANTPLSDGKRSGFTGEHLRDSIGVQIVTTGGATAARVGPTTAYGRKVGAFIEFGTDAHEIAPRPDGPGYLAWGYTSRVSPNPRRFMSSEHYTDNEDGRILAPVHHPGTEPNPVMMDALLAVAPGFESAVVEAGVKAAR